MSLTPSLPCSWEHGEGTACTPALHHTVIQALPPLRWTLTHLGTELSTLSADDHLIDIKTFFTASEWGFF